jgi:hypothetical protein
MATTTTTTTTPHNTNTATKDSPLFRLPLELRYEIYAYIQPPITLQHGRCLPDSQSPYHLPTQVHATILGPDTQNIRSLPSTSVCQQYHDEFTQHIAESCTFHFWNRGLLSTFLTARPGRTRALLRAHLRALSLTLDRHADAVHDVATVSALPRLRSLRVVIQVGALASYSVAPAVVRRMEADAVEMLRGLRGVVAKFELVDGAQVDREVAWAGGRNVLFGVRAGSRAAWVFDVDGMRGRLARLVLRKPGARGGE